MNELEHIGAVMDGAIVEFPNSAEAYMKVCSKDGAGGVVRLRRGLYIPTCDLEKCGLGVKVRVIAQNLDRFYFDEEN